MLTFLAGEGVRVPHDVAVIGYGNEPFGPYANPPLSTVEPPRDLMARHAVRILRERIRGQHDGEHQAISLQPTVVIRESCGPRAERSSRGEVQSHGSAL